MTRQAPAPSATAWLIDLEHVRGPSFVVLRCNEDEAMAALAEHLAHIGTVNSVTEAVELVAESCVASVGVVW